MHPWGPLSCEHCSCGPCAFTQWYRFHHADEGTSLFTPLLGGLGLTTARHTVLAFSITALATALNAKVTLVRVNSRTDDHTNVDEYLHESKKMLHQKAVPTVDQCLLAGDPATAIIKLARLATDSLVVMTTHRRSGLARWVFGSRC